MGCGRKAVEIDEETQQFNNERAAIKRLMANPERVWKILKQLEYVRDKLQDFDSRDLPMNRGARADFDTAKASLEIAISKMWDS